MIPQSLQQMNFHVTISPLLLGVAVAAIFVFWLIYSSVVFYHWKNYGTGKLEILQMSLIYFIGSSVLFGFLLFSFSAYALTAHL